MSEKIISKVTSQKEFEKLLTHVGILPTDTCLVHSALSSLGYMPGSEQSAVSALQNILHDGNIIMPEQTVELSDPFTWKYPPATKEAAAKITEYMPAYDKNLSPAIGMGKIPEYFRKLDGVVRNNQPLYSFSAWGKNAKYICSDAPTYDLPLGTSSPLQKIYNSNGKIIFIGTNYETCTAIHLAESTINRPLHYESAPVKDRNGNMTWIKFQNVDCDAYDDFEEFGKKFEEKYADKIQKVELVKGDLKVIPFRLLVDEARKFYTLKDLEAANN